MTRIWLELQFRNEVNVVMVAGALTLPQGSTLASCVGYQMTAGSIPSHTTHTHTHTHTSLLLSPAVRFLLGTNNIDPSLLTPTGPNNRLLKRYSTVNLSRT